MEDLIDSKELVESVVDNLLSSVVNSSNIIDLEPQDHLDQDLSIPVMDIFIKTRLSHFECSSCAKSYNFQDSFSFNLKCQTMLITCSQCSRWTLRRIGLKDKMIFWKSWSVFPKKKTAQEYHNRWYWTKPWRSNVLMGIYSLHFMIYEQTNRS